MPFNGAKSFRKVGGFGEYAWNVSPRSNARGQWGLYSIGIISMQDIGLWLRTKKRC